MCECRSQVSGDGLVDDRQLWLAVVELQKRSRAVVMIGDETCVTES